MQIEETFFLGNTPVLFRTKVRDGKIHCVKLGNTIFSTDADEGVDYVLHPQSLLFNGAYVRYTALTFLALQQVHPKILIDCGAGDGVLSLLAKKAYSIEKDPRFIDLYKYNHAKTKGTFLNEDIATTQLECAPDTVVANLGPHYGNAHIDAVNLLDRYPSVQHFVGGGFLKDSLGSRFGFEPVRQLLLEKGFQITTEALSAPYYEGGRSWQRIAFISKRV